MVAIYITFVLIFLAIRLLFLCIHRKKKEFRSATGNQFFSCDSKNDTKWPFLTLIVAHFDPYLMISNSTLQEQE